MKIHMIGRKRKGQDIYLLCAVIKKMHGKLCMECVWRRRQRNVRPYFGGKSGWRSTSVLNVIERNKKEWAYHDRSCVRYKVLRGGKVESVQD